MHHNASIDRVSVMCCVLHQDASSTSSEEEEDTRKAAQRKGASGGNNSKGKGVSGGKKAAAQPPPAEGPPEHFYFYTKIDRNVSMGLGQVSPSWALVAVPTPRHRCSLRLRDMLCSGYRDASILDSPTYLPCSMWSARRWAILTASLPRSNNFAQPMCAKSAQTNIWCVPWFPSAGGAQDAGQDQQAAARHVGRDAQDLRRDGHRQAELRGHCLQGAQAAGPGA